MSGEDKEVGGETPGEEETRDEETQVDGVRADAGDPSRSRKERVLHTRVPAVLEQELKRLATNLRIPVSNLVRAILEDAVDAVDAVGKRAEGELLGIAQQLAKQRDTLRTVAVGKATEPRTGRELAECPERDASLEGVIGFQNLVLAADSACTVCGRALPKGSRACRGVREEPGGPKVLVAGKCQLVPRDEA